MDLVSTVSEDGVRLDGVLFRSASSPRCDLGIDLFICHHGVAGNFYDSRMYGALNELILTAGFDVLRANNRGHDLVYSQPVGTSPALQRTRGRLGSAFEQVEDCRQDWTAWIDFAAAAGYRRIALWGHSLGAVKTVYFLASGSDERVCCAIASSPPRFCHEILLQSANGAEFQQDYTRAKALVAAGEPGTLMSVTVPTFNLFSAGTFLDKYGPQNRYDIIALLPKVHSPLLITLGDKEHDVVYRTLSENGNALMKKVPGAGFERIPGADHYYANRSGELWAAVQSWIGGTVPKPLGPTAPRRSTR